MNQDFPLVGQVFEKAIDRTAEIVRESFEKFLNEFQEPDAPEGEFLYIEQIDVMAQDERNTVFVDYEHLLSFDDGTLADEIQSDFYRYEAHLRKGLQNVVRKKQPAYAALGEQNLREFWVSIYGLPTIHKIRDLKTSKVGQLLTISGTVTRSSEIRPELWSGSFVCMSCNAVVRNVEQQFKYTEPPMCPGPLCQNRKNWILNVEQSKFVDWQRIRVQENSSEIPAGSMPRSLDIVLRNEIVDRARPGDKVVFTGTLIVVPDVAQMGAGKSAEMRGAAKARAKDGIAIDGVTGLKSLGVRDLSYKLCFLACMVQPADARFGTVNIREDNDVEDSSVILQQFSPEEIEEIRQMKSQPQIYTKLVNSIAPTVFGHETIKKGVLLMLFGGVHKKTVGDLNLRGDLNVCVVGDPSTAKSQFLKYVVSFLPRAVYTSGKASSAAGLTASVARDEETGEFTIEAGALMLADNGVCCIDEFDKMDVTDQVAIHEAMEQQTISIAKAGIQATLNARTSILAAANPQGGRYDPTKSLRANVAMTPAIMSRFDLFFVILDECDETSDFNIARHIIKLHQDIASLVPEYSTEQIQRYIKFARTLKPKITLESSKLLVDMYLRLRQSDGSGVGKSSYRITVRQLESLVRLSEALARLHCDDEVREKYVKEAYNLLQKSIIHVQSEDIQLEEDARFEANTDRPDEDAPNKRRKVDDEESQTEEAQKKSTQITFEKYKQIANLIVTHLRRNEDVEQNGMKKSEVISWYLDQVQDDLNTEAELLEQQDIIRKVVNRLIQKDNILLTLRETTDDDAMDTAEAQEADSILVVHPNYVVE